MVVDAMGGGAMRGYAEVDEEALAKVKGSTLPEVMGKGYLAVTLDSSGKDNQRYQGIVELTGDSFSEALQGYFVQSQQAQMQVHVAVKSPEAKAPGKKACSWRGGGIIIERVPIEGGKNADFTQEEQDDLWLRTGLFMRSLKDTEMLDADVTPQNLLYRLFNEDGVWVYKLQPLKAGCRCSRARMRSVLKSIPEAELLSSLDDDGKMVIHCQFCNKREIFTEAQVKQLYKKSAGPDKKKKSR
jgi:molecular chaperone Hsp33